MPRQNVIWVVLVSIASVACWQAAQSAPKMGEDEALYRLFVDAVENIDRSYVKEVDRRELIESAIAGMLLNLDTHSTYIGPRNFKQFDRHTKGQFGGIGIKIDMPDGILTVVSPLVGTPAYDAGILAGDRILKVNGEEILGLTQDQIVDRLTGPAGTDVNITVQHKPYTSDPFDVTLTRAVINIESVLGDTHGADDRWDFMLDKEHKIGYVRINTFMQTTKDDLQKALEQLTQDGMKGLILDLRYDPGGLLSSAIEVSDMFLTEGKIVGTSGRNREDQQYVAHPEGTYSDFPMAVLVNQASASASEIVAACLQDHQRAVIIGERTYGKGSVQNVIELEGGKSALKLTTASYQRPNGHNIHRFKKMTEEDEWGVKPNKGFEVAFTRAEHNQFFRWRRLRDNDVVGKVPESLKKEEPAKDADDSAKEKANQKDASKSTDDAKAADEANDSESDEESIADFTDRQLEKALEYIRGEIAGDSGGKSADDKD